jgi:hypothetical protein
MQMSILILSTPMLPTHSRGRLNRCMCGMEDTQVGLLFLPVGIGREAVLHNKHLTQSTTEYSHNQSVHN